MPAYAEGMGIGGFFKDLAKNLLSEQERESHLEDLVHDTVAQNELKKVLSGQYQINPSEQTHLQLPEQQSLGIVGAQPPNIRQLTAIPTGIGNMLNPQPSVTTTPAGASMPLSLNEQYKQQAIKQIASGKIVTAPEGYDLTEKQPEIPKNATVKWDASGNVMSFETDPTKERAMALKEKESADKSTYQNNLIRIKEAENRVKQGESSKLIQMKDFSLKLKNANDEYSKANMAYFFGEGSEKPALKAILDEKAQKVQDIMDNMDNVTGVAKPAARPAKQIKVKVRKTGQTGSIPENEFDSSIYQRL
jgi:hypothetical protein